MSPRPSSTRDTSHLKLHDIPHSPHRDSQERGGREDEGGEREARHTEAASNGSSPREKRREKRRIVDEMSCVSHDKSPACVCHETSIPCPASHAKDPAGCNGTCPGVRGSSAGNWLTRQPRSEGGGGGVGYGSAHTQTKGEESGVWGEDVRVHGAREVGTGRSGAGRTGAQRALHARLSASLHGGLMCACACLSVCLSVYLSICLTLCSPRRFIRSSRHLSSLSVSLRL